MASPLKKQRIEATQQDAEQRPTGDAMGSSQQQSHDGLAVMLTDVEEEPTGTLLLWGIAAEAGQEGCKPRTVLLCIPDYQPYFFIPCPQTVTPDSQEVQEPQPQELQRLRRLLNNR